jgi:hypothetical protein
LRREPIVASGKGHCGDTERSHCLPVRTVSAFMFARSCWANGTRFVVVLSKSKSNPSTIAAPKGRSLDTAVDWPGAGRPNMVQSWFALLKKVAVVKPPSLYVEPPRERRIFFPKVTWQVVMSAL